MDCDVCSLPHTCGHDVIYINHHHVRCDDLCCYLDVMIMMHCLLLLAHVTVNDNFRKFCSNQGFTGKILIVVSYAMVSVTDMISLFISFPFIVN